MNKRTLCNDENDDEKNKTGVKRYLMSNDDPFENQKLYHEKNCTPKLNSNNPLLEMKEEEYMISNINSSINVGSSNNINCNSGKIENDENDENKENDEINENDGDNGNSVSNDNNDELNRNSNSDYNNMISSNANNSANYNVNNNVDEFMYNTSGIITNNFGGCNNFNKNNENDCNNPCSNIYYSGDCKKRKGSRYVMPFLKKEKNSVNTELLLKNVPTDADEEDIKSFMRPFVNNKIPEILFDEDGIVVKLHDDELNEAIFNYFNEHPTQIKGSFVKVKLARTTDDSSNNNTNGNANSSANNSTTNIANDCAANLINQENLEHDINSNTINKYNNSSSSNHHHNNNNNNNSGNQKDVIDAVDKKNIKYNKNECSKVILVSVVNIHYPVDIELIYYLFSKCGVVEKIITFSRNPVVYQALVQFKNIETAKEAIKSLHNRNIYDGCNTIQIQYSFLKELVVKANNSSSWDYTISSVQKNKYIPNFQNLHGVLPTPTRKSKDSELYQLIERKFKLGDFEMKNASKTPVLICYNIPKDYTDVNKLFNLFSVYGFVSRIKILREKPDSALIQYSSHLFSSLAQEYLQHAKIGNEIIELHFSKIHDIRISPQQKRSDMYKAKLFSNYDQRYLMSDQVKYIKGACKPTKTLFISNVSEDVNEECIVNLLNKYGEINKLKFQPIKEGKKHLTITVELNSEDSATRALMDLHNFHLKDRSIKVSYTKTRLV
ncbi:polypyrimidine tract binding protein, putative [Plasmodium malariae]|uniref:Polypyrimidine tract binding protein, putative n=1 Tax=Plasmodium malariae TaxID=5858 RepID=A0A1C3L008_PLAMA|nr:polypyrimidine tract binding protein, putative [Plasmodium malariae]